MHLLCRSLLTGLVVQDTLLNFFEVRVKRWIYKQRSSRFSYVALTFDQRSFFLNFVWDRYFMRMFSSGLLMPVLRLLQIATEMQRWNLIPYPNCTYIVYIPRWRKLISTWKVVICVSLNYLMVWTWFIAYTECTRR